jgi:hypothetical protein
MKGRVMSDEHKKKISIANSGKKHSEESKLKMSMAKKGKKQSQETINKRALSFKIGGKRRKGETHPSTSLTNKKVRQIKSRLRDGDSVGCIAKLFDVSCDVIYKIRSGRTWKSVVSS